MAETAISVSKEFHDWLKSKGKKGEKYEDIIKRMLKPEYIKELNVSGKEGMDEQSSEENDEGTQKPDDELMSI